MFTKQSYDYCLLCYRGLSNVKESAELDGQSIILCTMITVLSEKKVMAFEFYLAVP